MNLIELEQLLFDAREQASEIGDFDDEQLNVFIDIVLTEYEKQGW